MNWLTQPLTWPDALALDDLERRVRDIARDAWPLWPVAWQAGCAAAMCAFGAAGVILLWPPPEQDRAQLTAAHQALQAQMQTQQARLSDLKRQADRHRDDVQALAHAQQTWPSLTQLQPTMMTLHRLAQTHGVALASFKPEPLAKQVSWAVQPVNVRLRGQFADLVAWSHALWQQDAVWSPEQWHWSAQSDGQVVLQALLHLYVRTDPEMAFQPQSVKADLFAQEGTAQRTGSVDPFQPPAPPVPEPTAAQPLGSDVHPLRRWPLQALQMVGSWHSEGKASALVQTPAGLFRVTVGDTLGSENGQVVRLDETRLQVRMPLVQGAGPARLADLAITPGSPIAKRSGP